MTATNQNLKDFIYESLKQSIMSRKRRVSTVEWGT